MPEELSPLVCLRIEQVMRMTGLCQSAVYAEIAANGFPRPIKIGKRRAAWILSEVEAWLRARIAAREEERTRPVLRRRRRRGGGGDDGR